MKYKQQLSLITSFIGLRILMLILYTFYKPAVSGPYTPYLLFLYLLFDILILCYFYRFVKGIKKQPFSLIAVILIILGIIFYFLIDLGFLFETGESDFEEIRYLLLFVNLPIIIARVILSVQLIANKAADHTKKYLTMVGWSYVITMLIGFALPFASMLLDYYFVSDPAQFFPLIGAIPLIAMMALFIYEIRHYETPSSFIPNSTLDSEL